MPHNRPIETDLRERATLFDRVHPSFSHHAILIRRHARDANRADQFAVLHQHEATFNRHRAGQSEDTHGGESIEDAPGLREGSLGAMHLAYVRDPDGNKLCAIHRAK